MVATTSRDELKRKLDSGEQFLLFETLPPHYFEQVHLPNAINLPPDRIRELAPKLAPNKSAEIIVYCGSPT